MAFLTTKVPVSGECLSHSAVARGLVASARLRQIATGAPKPTNFRPPYGSTSSNISSAAVELGMTVITWDERMTDGQVILMHENQNASLSAVPQIAAALEAKACALVASIRTPAKPSLRESSAVRCSVAHCVQGGAEERATEARSDSDRRHSRR